MVGGVLLISLLMFESGNENLLLISLGATIYIYIHTLSTQWQFMIKKMNLIKFGDIYCGQASLLQISNVTYINIWGRSNAKVAVTLRCSASKPCQNVILEDINLDYHGRDGPVTALCSHVNGRAIGHQSPSPCIQSCARFPTTPRKMLYKKALIEGIKKTNHINIKWIIIEPSFKCSSLVRA